jgi:hypothetical protein
MAATKPSAQNAAGVVKVRRKGCWFIGRAQGAQNQFMFSS